LGVGVGVIVLAVSVFLVFVLIVGWRGKKLLGLGVDLEGGREGRSGGKSER